MLSVCSFMNVFSGVISFSFEVVKVIHEKLLDRIGAGNKVPLVLVGNKTDLHMQRYMTLHAQRTGFETRGWSKLCVSVSVSSLFCILFPPQSHYI